MNAKTKTAFAVIVLMATVSFVAVPALSAGDADTPAVDAGYSDDVTMKPGSSTVEWMYSVFGAEFGSVTQTSGPATVHPYVNAQFKDMIHCVFSEHGVYTFDITTTSGIVSTVSVTVYDHEDSTGGSHNHLEYQSTGVITSGDTFRWTLTANPGVTITSITKTSDIPVDMSNVSTTGATLDLPVGIHTFEVTSTCSDGDSFTRPVTVTVTKACDHADAFKSMTGPMTVGQSVSIAGTGSAYTITTVNGASSSTDVTMTSAGMVTFNTAGTYTIVVSATCACGNQTSTEYTVSVVTPCTHADVFNSIAVPMTVGQSVSIAGTGSAYAITTVNGASSSTDVTMNPDGTMTFNTAGTYTIVVSATCACGSVVTYSYENVTVSAPAVPDIPPAPDAPINGTAPPLNGWDIEAL